MKSPALGPGVGLEEGLELGPGATGTDCERRILLNRGVLLLLSRVRSRQDCGVSGRGAAWIWSFSGGCGGGDGHRLRGACGPVFRHKRFPRSSWAVSYTHLRAHETVLDLVCRLLL